MALSSHKRKELSPEEDLQGLYCCFPKECFTILRDMLAIIFFFVYVYMYYYLYRGKKEKNKVITKSFGDSRNESH